MAATGERGAVRSGRARSAEPAGTTVSLDPYAVLVSESMLQQTQVATVIPYFQRWMAAFPTVATLAAADASEIMKYWQGLGYYSRARNLHSAAKMIMQEYGGVFPSTLDAIRELPGVGPYTAGAIASIAFDLPEPLVDGNVERVLSRIYGFTQDPRSKEGRQQLWDVAGRLMRESCVAGKTSGEHRWTSDVPESRSRPGDFNSSLMELGATVCAPRNPMCLTCPVAGMCRARAAGLTEVIPPVRKAKVTPTELRDVMCFRDPHGRYLVEQRPATGRWPGLWQFVTRPTPFAIDGARNIERLGEVRHQLTHRKYRFTVYHAEADAGTSVDSPGQSRWIALADLGEVAMSKPQLEVAKLLRQRPAVAELPPGG